MEGTYVSFLSLVRKKPNFASFNNCLAKCMIYGRERESEREREKICTISEREKFII